MRLSVGFDDCLVFDDVLEPRERDDVWSYLQREEFEPVHADRWKKVWRLSDGVPYRGPTVLAAAGGLTAAVAATEGQMAGLAGQRAEASVPGMRGYPTGTGIDRVIALILNRADDFAPVVGQKGAAWDRTTATASLYPQQTGLSWHMDGGRYAGAYIYYAHRVWNAQWGGELLLADLPPGRRLVRDHLDNALESELILDRGVGRYIMPKPNRLVVLRGGVLHQLRKVDPAAGDHVRCTIGGFFLRPDPVT